MYLSHFGFVSGRPPVLMTHWQGRDRKGGSLVPLGFTGVQQKIQGRSAQSNISKFTFLIQSQFLFVCSECLIVNRPNNQINFPNFNKMTVSPTKFNKMTVSPTNLKKMTVSPINFRKLPFNFSLGTYHLQKYKTQNLVKKTF